MAVLYETEEGAGVCHESERGHGARGEPAVEAEVNAGECAGDLRGAGGDVDMVIACAVDLGADGGVGGDEVGPGEGVPDGLSADGDGGVARGRLDGLEEAGACGEVADAAIVRGGGGFKLMGDGGEGILIADGRAGCDPRGVADVADDGGLIGRSPVFDAGVEDLVGGGVPAVAHDEAACVLRGDHVGAPSDDCRRGWGCGAGVEGARDGRAGGDVGSRSLTGG